jgi:hypothetical protein
MLKAGRLWVGLAMKSLNVFYLPNPSNRTMALAFTQPLTEMSIRRFVGVGVKRGRRVRLAN